MQETIANRVAESGIITINLESYYPKGEIVVYDLKDHLFMGLILKEKDFRAALLATEWNQYQDKNVAVTCTADAIIPVWAYMLVASYLQPVAREIVFGNSETLVASILQKNIDAIDVTSLADKRVVIKGCGDIKIPESAYLTVTAKLRPYVKSIMYGEPCSTVPVYRKK
jgi:hypothetical protein